MGNRKYFYKTEALCVLNSVVNSIIHAYAMLANKKSPSLHVKDFLEVKMRWILSFTTSTWAGVWFDVWTHQG